MQSTIIYFDPIGPRWQAGFRGPTEVSWVAKEPYGGWNRNVAALELSEQLYQALFFLNIVGRFEELPHEYMLTNYEEGILLNAGLLAAAQLLRDVAGQLAERYEWEVSTGIDEGAHISYRISADGGKLRGEMIGLARFLEEGHRRGLDAEFFFSCQYALDAFPVETTQMTQKPVALKQLVRP